MISRKSGIFSPEKATRLVGSFLLCLLLCSCGGALRSPTYSIVGFADGQEGQVIAEAIERGYRLCDEPRDNFYPEPYITIKRPFEGLGEAELSVVLEELASAFPPFEVTITGYGEFDNFNTIYLQAMGDTLQHFHYALVEDLKKKGVQPHPFDRTYNPHVTLAEKPDNRACFIKYFNTLRDSPPPLHGFRITSVALSRKDGRQWTVLKSFALQGQR